MPLNNSDWIGLLDDLASSYGITITRVLAHQLSIITSYGELLFWPENINRQFSATYLFIYSAACGCFILLFHSSVLVSPGQSKTPHHCVSPSVALNEHNSPYSPDRSMTRSMLLV